ncbi:Pyruvate carboxylase [Seminavis robusta]|uniref:pyruvate carboxylase n=1 Tax=Seminavis robusta TaxID=568900 RepID=A0A9N8H2X3_9STRA|nr:Pyruvate carboxylase [Seminavis robusta]|eukprot:Sro46_g027270.1 Pyruvate carboxylase (1289) ;mRNA; r:5034-9155
MKVFGGSAALLQLHLLSAISQHGYLGVQGFSLSPFSAKTTAISSAASSSKIKTLLQATVEKEDATVTTNNAPATTTTSGNTPPFKNIMAANRAEIAVRIMRAATELNSGTVGIYVAEDSYSQHRWGADRSFQLEKEDSASPISAYLDIDQIIQIAKDANVDAIHPGYGFLSESPDFAQACGTAGITFVGPTVDNLLQFSDKTKARQAAIDAGVPVVPGSDGALQNAEEVVEYVEKIGLPVILKAAMGGGGKGMRVVRTMEDVVPLFEAASSEALASFGDGAVFVERFVDRPRHIEIQIIGDGTGNVVHLWERDCSVQRRHQKVIEMAPAWTLSDELRQQLHQYAVQLTSAAKYKNAGTVEFLVDAEMRAYFIEVNPRIQVEHTVTEEVTGIDLVQAQIRIASGATLEQVGLIQENIVPRGVAIQCRVTTENPERDFAPDTGRVTLYRHSAGYGVRMDGIGYSGLEVTPFFDSMLVKYTVRGSSFQEAVARMKRVLQECRIRGVKTNIGFLMNVLAHPEFSTGSVTTSFIDENPSLKQTSLSMWDYANEDQSDPQKLYETERLLRYLANLAVNGHPPELGADPHKMEDSCHVAVKAPVLPTTLKTTKTKSAGGMRKILLEQGPEGYAKAVREHKGLMIMDTTWRDAHQSLLATRMRTQELLRCADYTNTALANAFSLEMWGGATFDVSMRFLHECPWDRLEKLREAVPDVPFQMLLRGANAVGYTNYPDNLVFKFCEQAKKSGIDVFRVFDSLNYLDNLKIGIEAARAAGGFVEGTMSYTGDVADPSKSKYNLDYYLDLARQLVEMGSHSLAIKDMAGLLTPTAATMLVGALRKEHPDVPIHVHTHDTAGSGVASMIAAAEAGADVVDAAIDAMSGMTSQPSLGALVANLRHTDLDTGIDLETLQPLNSYWENVRSMYGPFESGQLSGSSDVVNTEIPGGQYTNMLFQSKQLGLGEKWPEIKRKYAEAVSLHACLIDDALHVFYFCSPFQLCMTCRATHQSPMSQHQNIILGDIPKVTPSSKVVGDLAQFMVSQNLDAQMILDQAETLAFPDSVVNYLKGDIGIPPGGFPEPLRSKVLNARGAEPVEGRPGASMPDYDFEAERKFLEDKYGPTNVSNKDILSYALYPQVFTDYKDFAATYGTVAKLPTGVFLNPMKVGDEVEIELGFGKTINVRLASIRAAEGDGTRVVIFERNGEAIYMSVTDHSIVGEEALREKADGPGQVGAPMPGVIVGMQVKVGDEISEGDAIATMSAMKMETSIPATTGGVVKRVLVNVGDKVEGDDLLVEIE